MKRKGQKTLLKILSIFILILLVGLFYLFLSSKPLSVRDVMVTTDYDFTANQEITKILEKLKGENIFFLKEDDLSQKLKSGDIKIKDIKIKKELPGKLLINIQGRQAIAVIPLANSFFLIDKEGLVFSEEREASGLPILDLGLQNIGIGSRIDDREKNIFTILDSLKGEEEVISILVAQEEVQIKLGEGLLVLFLLQEKPEEKLNSLQIMLARFRIEGKRPTKIDLRFEKPVVTF